MKTVLVTGGTGFIGSHLVLLLLLNHYEVIVIDNLSNSKITTIERIKFISKRSLFYHQDDVRNHLALKKIFKSYPIDSVIHFAGLKSVAESQSDPLKYYDCNVSGSITLIQEMLNAGVYKLVFSSSATVYGAPGSPNTPRICPQTPLMCTAKLN